jgi:PAS domain S-box-containing protein
LIALRAYIFERIVDQTKHIKTDKSLIVSGFWSSALAWAVVTLVFGSFLSSLFFMGVRNVQLQQAQWRFENLSHKLAAELVSEFNKSVHGLNGLRAGLVAHDFDRKSFQSMVAARDLPREFPGMLDMAFVERVEQHEVAAFVARERAHGMPSFRFRQLEDRSHDVHYVVRFIEPAANASDLGLDMGSEQRRRAAIEQSLTLREPTVSAAMVLRRNGQTTPGVLLNVPIYPEFWAVAPTQTQRAQPIGVVNALVVIADVLQTPAVQAMSRNQVVLQLLDVTPQQTAPEGDLWFGPNGLSAPSSLYKADVSFDLFGRKLRLQTRSTAVFEEINSLSDSFGVLVAGFCISLLSAVVIYLLRDRWQRASSSLLTYSRDTAKYAVLMENTTSLVIFCDTQGHITWVNRAFVQESGYALHEVLGRQPGALLQCEKTDPSEVARIAKALNSTQSYTGEILNCSKTGKLYWIELRINPLFSSSGVLEGYVAMAENVTQRHPRGCQGRDGCVGCHCTGVLYRCGWADFVSQRSFL